MRSISRRHAFRSATVLAIGCNLATVQTVAAGEAPLAIRGYDAVAYFTDGRPRHGLAEIEYEWDQQRYRFATADHRELFRANPRATRRSSQISAPCHSARESSSWPTRKSG